MAHEFDVIENAILEALEPLRHEGVRAILPYAGQFEEEAALMQLRSPFILVGAWRLRIEPRNRVDELTTDVSLWVGVHSVRGPQTALSTSPAGAPGVRDILESARALINAEPIIPGWSVPAWQEETAVIIGPRNSITVYEARYEIKRALGRG